MADPRPVATPEPLSDGVVQSPLAKTANIRDFLITSLYFAKWEYADRFRRALRFGVGAILIAALVPPIIEMMPEVARKLLPYWMASPPLFLRASAYALFALAIALVIWHNWREARKPEYEYAFIKSLFEFTESYQRAANTPESMKLSEALKVFHTVFGRADIHRVAVYLEQNGVLTVAQSHMYPPIQPQTENLSDYFPVLRVGKGIAGRVYRDGCPRYVPYSLRNGQPVPHALMFDPQRGSFLKKNQRGTGRHGGRAQWNHVPFSVMRASGVRPKKV